ATSDEQRFASLVAEGAVSAADSERQQARAEAARARHQQAQRQVQLARNRSGYTTLTAPYDGVVTAISAEAGQVVAEGQPVVSLARQGEIEIVAD
ncbi:HlyD family efflux transporter periplasmic adaptor subunit, partial [Acinetobacter baumannii]